MRQRTPTERRRRYEELQCEIEEPEFVPDHPIITDQVLRPLREAKYCYVLGMFVACISQAGLVGEMVALWRFRMLEPELNGKSLDEELQKLVCGDRFDRLGQHRRVEVLRAIEEISPLLLESFNRLREVRRKYLHFFIEPMADIEADARLALKCACDLVRLTLDLSRVENRLTISDKLKQFLKK